MGRSGGALEHEGPQRQRDLFVEAARGTDNRAGLLLSGLRCGGTVHRPKRRRTGTRAEMGRSGGEHAVHRSGELQRVEHESAGAGKNGAKRGSRQTDASSIEASWNHLDRNPPIWATIVVGEEKYRSARGVPDECGA